MTLQTVHRRSPFCEGAKAAIPVWIVLVPYSFAVGIAAKTHGLHLEEIALMSALVFSGPAQFAALEPLASGKPGLQILLTTLLINFRFLVMSTALAHYFRRVRLLTLIVSSHFISASTFVVSYVHFQKGTEPLSASNVHYFLGVAVTSFSVWVLSSGLGYWAALRVPVAFEEGLKFILPGYFACMLVTELRGRTARLIGVASFLAAVPGAQLSRDWGWLGTAILIATVGWGMEQWIRRGSQ